MSKDRTPLMTYYGRGVKRLGFLTYPLGSPIKIHSLSLCENSFYVVGIGGLPHAFGQHSGLKLIPGA